MEMSVSIVFYINIKDPKVYYSDLDAKWTDTI